MYKPTTTAWKPPVTLFFKLSVIASAVAGLGLTTGCSSTPAKAKVQKSQSGMLDANSLDSLEDLLSATDMRAVEGDRLLILKHGDVWKRMTVGFKMDENKWDPRIEAQREWFITRQPYIERLSARASRYLYHTVKEAERRGLPTELALLPVIESSYDPAATSSAAAAGMWQFIPSTGKIYGLRQTTMYDGRRDVVESTRAAYEFLGSLYNQFGSWELALAAYNAGPGRIQQAINRNRAAGLPTDYWSLRLPQETMNYVPRFMAVAQIIKSPHKYGVNLPPIANRPHFREVGVPAGSSLNEIASITGLSRAELYQLNPGHRGDIVDATSTMRILIPADLNPNIDARLKSLKSSGGGYWAGGTSPSSNAVTTKTTTSPMVTSSNPPPVLNQATQNQSAQSKSQSTASTVAVTTSTKPVETKRPADPQATLAASVKTPSTSSTPMTVGRTPRGSDALAAFASSAVLPSAPRIPVAITPAVNVKPVLVEPPISADEREKILGTLPAEPRLTAEQVIEKAIEPEATQAEKDEVVKEITALAPKGTEIVDPLDGKIKLTAIQTSQSVAAQQGSEVKVGFAYPKSVAENTAASSEEAKLNQNKTFEKTDSEVIVSAPKGKRSTYTVLPGDTLAVIAMKNGVNWRDIAKWNQVDPNGTLFVGTTLYLYDAKPPVQESKVAEKKVEERPSTYVVKPNDHLTGLANEFDLSVQDLAEWNGLNVNSNLFVGQKLSLVEKKGATTKSQTTSKSQTAAKTQSQAKPNESSSATASKIKTQSYVVKRGEYLKLIADRYALSNQELASLTEGLKADTFLIVGQRINVPVDPLTPVKDLAEKNTRSQIDKVSVQPAYKMESYRVQSGESLYSIAMKSNITLNELVELNDLQTNKGLYAGQMIKVPVSNKVPDSYTVQSGDSLHAVASKYNLGIAQVAELNGLKPSAGLFVGQKLKLTGTAEVSKAVADRSSKSEARTSTKSSNEAVSEVYAVRSGETLASIARKFGMQLDDLLELNDLSRQSTIRVGQRLKVSGEDTSSDESSSKAHRTTTATPKSSANSNRATEPYTVKAGESLNVIASRMGITTKELADLNDMNARSGLQRGQTLQVPKLVTEYKVRSGDSMIRIATRFGIETDQLADMNDLKSNASLQVGDILKVPNF